MVYEISLKSEFGNEVIGIYYNEERALEALEFYKYFYKDFEDVKEISMIEITYEFARDIYENLECLEL